MTMKYENTGDESKAASKVPPVGHRAVRSAHPAIDYLVESVNSVSGRHKRVGKLRGAFLSLASRSGRDQAR